MEKSFDLGSLLRNHAKKHKVKPTQFVSVAGGVQKRVETRQKYRKSSRLTFFDSIRNLSRCTSPTPHSEAQQKLEHRRQQLEKWKEEKEKKKKEAAAQKKKPFIAGVPRAPQKYVPPPPAKPSTSGRVTRSQSTKNTKPLKEKQKSFAPKNAMFNPPPLKNALKLPYFNPVALKPKNKKKTTVMFEPVLPNNITINDNVKQTRSRTQIGKEATFIVKPDTKIRGKPKPVSTKFNIIQSSSSSEKEVFSKSLPTKPSHSFQSSSESTETDSSPTISKKKTPVKSRTRKSMISSPIQSQKLRKSLRTSRISLPLQLTPKNQVPKSESSSEERLRSPKNLDLTPEQIIEEAKKSSPRVTMSRGKDNARREMKKKLDEGLLDEDTSDIDNIDHFRRQLASEIKRMTEMCDTWDKILEQNALPESIQECILGAVGQARLLMSQKLRQFASLVERCARPEPGVALVTPADLHGFWDMVFMQVENVDMRFKKLEELRARDWTEEQPELAVKRKPAPPPKALKTKPIGNSRIKDMIAAARKAKKEQLPIPVEKTFEAGFFCVQSPVRSPHTHTPRTPSNKPSLLKAVLSSEAQKASASKQSASFAMLRASVLGKNVECDGVAPLPETPQHNANATPGRSILKQSTNRSKKSIKVVLFDQSDTDINSSFTDKTMDQVNQTNFTDLVCMDVTHKGKENRRKSHRLTRQDAEDRSPVMTRSRRQGSTPHVTESGRNSTEYTDSLNTSRKGDEKGNRRSSRRRDVLQEVVV